jgi:hypothetical protein
MVISVFSDRVGKLIVILHAIVVSS